MSQDGGDFLKGLIFGGLAGAIIGILYAPRSGRETREELTHKADELIARAKEEYEKNREDYEAAYRRVKEAGELIKHKASEVEEKIGKLTQSGKETAEDKKKD
ncbi:MAG TPA: YtxH domain-containing protein [Deltaproteobacteria bacterium]|nr:YtxH domain-containing protein [Deltaproteobacteria bacterium]